MRIKSAAERRLEGNIGEAIRGMDVFWNDEAGDADLLAEAIGRLKRTYRRDLRLLATGAGRAVQDDGLDVERLAEAIRRTALDHYRPEASSSYAHRVAKHYAVIRAAPPPHDPSGDER